MNGRVTVALVALSLTALLPALAEVSRLPEPVHQQTGADPPDEALLKGLLLPKPKGYQETDLEDEPGQSDPFHPSPLEERYYFQPYTHGKVGDGMGWTRPDSVYFSQIPAQAREFPSNFKSLPVLRFNNIDVNREREIRFREHGDYDQWFLQDFTAPFTAMIVFHRPTRHIYFFDYKMKRGQMVQAHSVNNCYNCHPSGLRTIRTYAIKKTDKTLLDAFNRRILSYGAADFGDNIDPKRLGPALDDDRCTGCHEGRTRGKLYRIHMRPLIYYFYKLHNMPPGAPLVAAESKTLLKRLHDGWKAAIMPATKRKS
jgi:hypothetical protein